MYQTILRRQPVLPAGYLVGATIDDQRNNERRAILCLLFTATGMMVVACNEGRSEATGTIPVIERILEGHIEAVGSIQPDVGAEVKVGPRISGVLAQLTVEVGDTVRKGQLLAVLDDTILNVHRRERDAAVAEAQATLDHATANARRIDELYAQGIASLEHRDTAVKEVRTANARLAAAIAQSETAHVTQDFARIYAPIDGTVTSISTQVGETVVSSFAVPTFLTIVDLDRLHAELLVDEVDIGRVAIGQDVTVSVDAYPAEELQGRIKAIPPHATIRSGIVYFTVIADIDGTTPQLRPAMSVVAQVHTGERRTVLMVPARAIYTDETGRSRVVIVTPSGERSERTISIGETIGNDIVVTSGLTPGEQIAVEP